MSAWPEAVYVINKINYAIDAKLDIDENGIRNINNLNARVDELNLLVEDPSTDPPTGIVPTQNEINDLLADIEDSLEQFQEDYDAAIAQLNAFDEALATAEHRIVYIGQTSQVVNPSQYSVVLIES